jgi:hypothetical protein
MTISVSGCKDKVLESKLFRAIEFFAEQLGIKDQISGPDHSVHLGIVQIMKHQGLCWTEDNVSNIDIRLNFAIKKYKEDPDIFLILAHEMVHVKQEVLKEYTFKLDRDGNLIDFWRGKKWKAKKGQLVELDAPWELEAYKLETVLYDAWSDSHK